MLYLVMKTKNHIDKKLLFLLKYNSIVLLYLTHKRKIKDIHNTGFKME